MGDPCRHRELSFRGTTDEIIRWAAWKWGIDEDLLRAVAARESD
jgi:soluble lytic murein transglycosylase-like protein